MVSGEIRGMAGDGSQFAVHFSRFTVRDRQAARSKCKTQCNAAPNNCELQTVNRELRTVELTPGDHVDDLDAVICLYVLVAEIITSDRFAVPLNQYALGG
jgi:hypothetical protein